MADPFTLGAVALGATAAGSLFGAYGKYQEGQGQAALYNYQAQIAQQNAQIQKQNAEYAGVAGEQQAKVSGLRTGAQIHTNIARQGASGIVAKAGSSSDVISSERSLGEIDQQTIRENAARQVFGYQAASASASAQSNVYGMASSNASTAGSIGAIGSLIGGVSSVSDKWLSGSAAGLYSSGSSGGY